MPTVNSKILAAVAVGFASANKGPGVPIETYNTFSVNANNGRIFCGSDPSNRERVGDYDMDSMIGNFDKAQRRGLYLAGEFVVDLDKNNNPTLTAYGFFGSIQLTGCNVDDGDIVFQYNPAVNVPGTTGNQGVIRQLSSCTGCDNYVTKAYHNNGNKKNDEIQFLLPESKPQEVFVLTKGFQAGQFYRNGKYPSKPVNAVGETVSPPILVLNKNAYRARLQVTSTKGKFDPIGIGRRYNAKQDPLSQDPPMRTFAQGTCSVVQINNNGLKYDKSCAVGATYTGPDPTSDDDDDDM